MVFGLHLTYLDISLTVKLKIFRYTHWNARVRLGSQYVALACRSMPRCRAASIESVSLRDRTQRCAMGQCNIL